MMIKNIKSSIVFACSEDWKTCVIKNLQKNNVSFKERGNIFIIKSFINLCIIENKKCSENIVKDIYLKKSIHVNLSGVKSFEAHESIISFIHSTYFDKKWVILKSQIDNTTSTFLFPLSINLKSVKERNLNVKYNPEKFPGLFLRTNFGTSVIFGNGKVNIIGCKNLEQIKEVWRVTFSTLATAIIQVQ